MEAVSGEGSEGVKGKVVVEGPEGPGAVEAVGGEGSEGVKGKVVVEGCMAVVEGCMAVVEGGSGPEEDICMTVMTI
ncbi:hypothetical protein CYMTET_45182 [Cymbomonas tetramitiformis]|uniref:Uncharacterized protein n=1 Tax=Cymbomonas tetramitiformis TaxID=36881 RepID=A0AAE0EYA4_9CHLO|nr:hypothetical protein CYMTET_45182 [Cymbomonas tetramitiformis]